MMTIFVANLPQTSLHTLLMVVIVKPLVGGIFGWGKTILHMMFWWTGNDADQVIEKMFYKDPPSPVLEKPA